MTVQYKETDWQYALRLAGRLATIVVPNYTLDGSHIAIGVPIRPAKEGIVAISYSIKKDVDQYLKRKAGGGFSERDAISCTVKSREIFDLCDPVPFQNLAMYVYAIDTRYEGSQLVHYYTLKEIEGFSIEQSPNERLIGASLRGLVKEVQGDKVRIDLDGDVVQTMHKWFPYATPFSQPNGIGWYFMPEIGDEVRLRFASENEGDAYVASAVHAAHGRRQNPEVKSISTVYGQAIQFEPGRILIDDGAGSRVSLHSSRGISLESDKTINIEAESDITVSASGKVMIAGAAGVVMQKGSSVVSVGDAVDISAGHTRVQ
jgi:hypothetical protein